MHRLHAKTAVVTGAASGVGRATAAQMIAEGAHVYGVDVDAEGLDAAADDLGEQFVGAVHDIRSRQACHAAIDNSVSNSANSTYSPTSPASPAPTT